MSGAIIATNNAVAASINEQQAAALFETLVVNGDLSAMTQDQRIQYYKLVCERVGLDPYQKPFDLIKLSGKLTLYANKNCTAQLCKLHKMQVGIMGRGEETGLYIVTARAAMPDGSFSEDMGVVSVVGLQGEAKSNAILKATTKAKRRAILSACGLGLLDETEVDSIPNAERVELPPITPPNTPEQDELISTWLSAIDAATGPEEMTAIVFQIKELPEQVKAPIREYAGRRAKELNLYWKAGLYHEVTP